MLTPDDRSTKLYNLAQVEKGKSQHALRKCSYTELKPAHLSEALLGLALEATGKGTLEEAEILPVFFTEEACKWLMKLPNLYWFWQVVALAPEWELESGCSRIEVMPVWRAMGVLREQVPRKWIESNLPLDLLPVAQVVARTSRGMIMAKGLGDNLEIVRNIIFTLDYTPKY